MIVVSAPGKIHVSGEHSVVYGQPALLASVEKRVRVFGKIISEDKIFFYDKNKCKKKVWDYSKIETFTNWAQDKWEKFVETGDITYLASIKKDEWSLPKISIGYTYQFLQKKPKKGISLELHSDLPIGAGMGSSAATAVALVGAIFCLEKQPWDLEKINKIAYEIEKKMHGFPSGGDNTVIVYGGILKCQKKKNKINIKNLVITKDIPELILINSGQAQESTAHMVEKVHGNYMREQARFQEIFFQMGQVTEDIVTCLQQGALETFGEIITKNQYYLEQLGLVGKKAKNIIKLIEKNGGFAKICGAGGCKKGSGVILAYHTNLPKLVDVLKEQNIIFFKFLVSQKGVMREHV